MRLYSCRFENSVVKNLISIRQFDIEKLDFFFKENPLTLLF